MKWDKSNQKLKKNYRIEMKQWIFPNFKTFSIEKISVCISKEFEIVF